MKKWLSQRPNIAECITKESQVANTIVYLLTTGYLSLCSPSSTAPSSNETRSLEIEYQLIKH